MPSRLTRLSPVNSKLEPPHDAIRAHYLEMPGLSLTPLQVRRLCGLDALKVEACEAFLEALVVEGFLRRSNDGRYHRAA
jgi:hypothetical protein